MTSVSTYLNFERETEEAFAFYRSVFGTEYVGPPMRFGDLPAGEGAPPIPEEDRNLIMNIALPIVGGHILMGTDCPESMGMTVTRGNNVFICLDPPTRAEAERLFAALTDGGEVQMALADQFWGDYFGSLIDRFGIHWMINCTA
jgi:PhnB protein